MEPSSHPDDPDSLGQADFGRWQRGQFILFFHVECSGTGLTNPKVVFAAAASVSLGVPLSLGVQFIVTSFVFLSVPEIQGK